MFSYIKQLDVKSKLLLKNIFFSVLTKGIAVIVSLLTLPAYINFFSNQVILGVWFTAISILTWILTFDLGIGNGLRNLLVEPLVKNDYNEIKKYLSSAYTSLGLLVIAISIFFIIVIPYINWNGIFNISPSIINNNVLRNMMTILVIGVLIQFWLKLIVSVLYALQKSVLPGMMSLISAIIMLIFIQIFKSTDITNSIYTLSSVYVVIINVPYLIVSIILFQTKLNKARPTIYFFKKSYSEKIIKLGGAFFYLQVLALIIFGTNEFFIAWLVDPKEVVTYQIYNKIFSLISTFFNLALTPVWSAVTEACVRKDYPWIMVLYKKLNLILLCLVPFEVIIIVLMPFIIDIWLGENAIVINYMYCILFAVFSIMFMLVSIGTSIINGLNRLKIQAYALTLAVLLKMIITFIISQFYDTFIIIVIANIISLIPFIVIMNLAITNVIKQIELQ